MECLILMPDITSEMKHLLKHILLILVIIYDSGKLLLINFKIYFNLIKIINIYESKNVIRYRDC